MSEQPVRFQWEQQVRAARLCEGRRPALLAVAFYVATFADINGEGIRVGARRIASDTGIAIRTVEEALRDLTSLGWLHTVRASYGANQATQRRLHLPNPSVSQLPEVPTIAAGEVDPWATPAGDDELEPPAMNDMTTGSERTTTGNERHDHRQSMPVTSTETNTEDQHSLTSPEENRTRFRAPDAIRLHRESCEQDRNGYWFEAERLLEEALAAEAAYQDDAELAAAIACAPDFD